ncbi:MAG TPA: DUF3631 domain-containing protein [Verrucomicrobiae bacterium]
MNAESRNEQNEHDTTNAVPASLTSPGVPAPGPAPAPGWMFDVEPWSEPVDGILLLDELRDILSRFVILPRWSPETCALWVLHTYAFHLRDVSAYIGIESPQKRCGKTTLINLLRRLVRRPEVAANISSPAFFRVIEETRPTLLMDEADTLLLGNDELRGILNSGYSKDTAYVVRVNPQPSTTDARPASRLARFSCWCPKLIAGIGHLPDTLADRCIVIRMHRKTPAEKCDRLRHLVPTPLKQKCARFVLDHAADIAGARPSTPPGLNDRAADIWEPLLALADIAGGHWPELARNAAVGLTVSAEENSPVSALLFDIFVIFATAQADKMFSRDLVLELNSLPDRPWAELRRGKAINELWLAQQLRKYDVRPRSIWIGDAASKGYLFDDFGNAFRRYVPRSELEALRESLTASPPPSGDPPPAPVPEESRNRC